MYGDFSKLDLHRGNNSHREDGFAGVLQQQGRVLLDSDRNADTWISIDWRDHAGRDTIGPGVAAIPAHEHEGLKVISAKALEGNKVEFTVHPGRGWADGLSVRLPDDPNTPVNTPVTRTAAYLVDPPDPTGGEIRDAVVLEVYREAVNGFQMPDSLIEPALGGPDTTERVHTAMRFRLLRLEEGDTCQSIGDKLADDPKGTLTVRLEPTDESLDPDCPVVEHGGYTGFEHHLYRIEIADVDGNDPMFKWSQFNGGLVGRGRFDADKVEITANLQAIISSGLESFYLEAIEWDDEEGRWRVTYGAEATLNPDNQIELDTVHFGSIPLPPSDAVFFRLWNGIRKISDFQPGDLHDGVILEFDGAYVPGDYWTFHVRAGEIGNPHFPLEKQSPHGISYHRVPLAILHWDGVAEITADAGEIEDCRDIFRPLTKQTVCCSFTVGDGILSHGDFDSIEEALRHLPDSGGEICLLPGHHEANVKITKGKKNIRIAGCGKQTEVIPRPDKPNTPIFHVVDSTCITLEDMDLFSPLGNAIVLEGTEFGDLQEIKITNNQIIAGDTAIQVSRGVDITISHNKIRLLDRPDAGVALFVHAEDGLIERNDIAVVPAPDEGDRPPDGDDLPDPRDPCADWSRVFSDWLFRAAFTNIYWTWTPPLLVLLFPSTAFNALGGIQIAAGSRRVDVRENEVWGGASNGITLGGQAAPVELVEAEGPSDEEVPAQHPGGRLKVYVRSGGESIGEGFFLRIRPDDDDGGTPITEKTEGDGGFEFSKRKGAYLVSAVDLDYRVVDVTVASGDVEFQAWTVKVEKVEVPAEVDELLAWMYDICIDRNEIAAMGLSGIGVPRVSVKDRLGRVVDSPRRPIRVEDRAMRLAELAELAAGMNIDRLGVFFRFLTSLGSYVVGLSIHDNHISHCLQNPFDDELSTLSKTAGLGGISLGACDGLSIRNNRIEDNGRSHVYPVCGIFITSGQEIDISHNYIANNGPLRGDRTAQPGVRGGIVVHLATSISLRGNDSDDRARPAVGRPAARVHDNVVDQPMGRALTMRALGPLSVVNNQFNTERAGSDRIAGAVLIVNLGGFGRQSAGPATTDDLGSFTHGPAAPGEGAALEGIAAASFAMAPMIFTRLRQFDRRWPNGNTLFNSNQTRLGPDRLVFFSQVIVSQDDVGFDGNHSDTLNAALLSDTFLWGATVRASDSRFKETPGSTRISLVTISALMNATTSNQGNHCIIAINSGNTPVFDAGNQSLISSKACRELEERLRKDNGLQTLVSIIIPYLIGKVAL